MSNKYFCPYWGSQGLSWDIFIEKVKISGYDGIEYAVTKDASEEVLSKLWNETEKHGLLMIAQHYDTNDADFSRHYDAYANWLEKLKLFMPYKINSQTGRDFFTFDQNKALIDLASQFTKDTGITVCHETHRSRFSFAAHITEEYLIRIPILKLTLDASHWICVAENYLQDQQKAMEKTILHTNHIHARIGYPEGPQVSDPRLPEWQEAVDIHLSWWDKVAALNKEDMTICPEFGPAPYMPVLPFTRQPVANQWDINVYIMDLLKERW